MKLKKQLQPYLMKSIKTERTKILLADALTENKSSCRKDFFKQVRDDKKESEPEKWVDWHEFRSAYTARNLLR